MGNYATKNLGDNTEGQSPKRERAERGGLRSDLAEVSNSQMYPVVQSTEKSFEQPLNVQTPQAMEKILPLDPRSVTAGIHRTPIEVDSTPVKTDKRFTAIPKHLRVKQRYLETDLDKVMPRLTPKKRCIPRIAKPSEASKTPSTSNNGENLEAMASANAIKYSMPLTPIEKDRYNILGIDPRSPAADFDRTPILISKLVEHQGLTDSLENLSRRGSYETDASCSSFSYCETSSRFINVPEIQALPDMITRALKSINLEDIDVMVNRHGEPDESYSSHGSETDTFSDSDDDQTVKHRANDAWTTNIELTPAEIQQTCQESNKSQTDEEITKINNDNQKIIIWSDSPPANESSDVDNGSTETSSERIVVKTNNPAKNVCSRKNLSNIESDTCTRNEKHRAVGSESRQFTNKLKSEAIKVRTPLGNRLNNGQVRTLLSNSSQPLFRNKGVNQRLLQENTPPHKSCVTKSRLTGVQWDADSTVLI